MDVREALYTTRAMRRVTSEPIPLDAQARILDAAVRAPSGGNSQNWRFLLVDSDEVKAAIAPIYKRAIDGLWTGYYKDRIDAAQADPESAESKSMPRSRSRRSGSPITSRTYRSTSSGSAPTRVAARSTPRCGARSSPPGPRASVVAHAGVGVLQRRDPRDPGRAEDAGWYMAGALSFGYPTGRWGVAVRQPARGVLPQPVG